MRIKLLAFCLFALFAVLSCAKKDSLTYEVDTGRTTLNGKELNPDEILEYLEGESHSDSQITVIIAEGNEKTMTVGEFNEAVDEIARSIQGLHLSGENDADRADEADEGADGSNPFKPKEPEPFD